MPRSALLALSLCTFGPVVTTAGCHAAGCQEGDAQCVQPSTESTAGSTGPTTGDTPTSTGAPATTTSTGDEGTTVDPDTTGSTMAVCGDGVVEGDEACDDGNDDNTDDCVEGCAAAACGDGFTWFGSEACDDGNADDTDDCTNVCETARCGDGVVHATLEACDNGSDNNDNTYQGCTTQCQPGPDCGDGKVNGPEDCDDQNSDPADGCLDGCVEATSCLQILTTVPGAPTGAYIVWPEALGGDIDVAVWCEMTVDGGGYTFLKVDTQIENVSDKGAAAAEAICELYGMHLLVTRTQAHTLASYQVATTPNVPPVGGGVVATGTDYLAILAIYPTVMGATCEDKGLNSVDCPGWHAWDDNQFWVTATPVPGEPSSEHCDGCSMLYKWNPDGTLKSYTTFPSGEGAGTYRFLCDIADKY